MKIQLTIMLFLVTSCASNQATESKVAKTPAPQAAPANESKKVEPSTQANSEKKLVVDSYSCNYQADVRKIYIESLTPAGCKLWYSKNNNNLPTASSQNGYSHCERISQNIRHNLEKSGFKCTKENDVANTK